MAPHGHTRKKSLYFGNATGRTEERQGFFVSGVPYFLLFPLPFAVRHFHISQTVVKQCWASIPLVGNVQVLVTTSSSSLQSALPKGVNTSEIAKLPPLRLSQRAKEAVWTHTQSPQDLDAMQVHSQARTAPACFSQAHPTMQSELVLSAPPYQTTMFRHITATTLLLQ